MEEEPEIQYLYSSKIPLIIKPKTFYMIKSFEICDFAVLNNRHEKIDDIIHINCKDLFKDKNFVIDDDKEYPQRLATYCDYTCNADFNDERGNIINLNSTKRYSFGTGMQQLEFLFYGLDLNQYYLKNGHKFFIIIKLYNR